jgi:hypothetical protein
MNSDPFAQSNTDLGALTNNLNTDPFANVGKPDPFKPSFAEPPTKSTQPMNLNQLAKNNDPFASGDPFRSQETFG